MNLATADRHNIIERLLEHRVPVALAPGYRGDAELALATGRGVEPELCEAVTLELGFDGRRRMIIWELQFDRLEARGGGSAETFEQRTFGEEVHEIGGEAGHVNQLAL